MEKTGEQSELLKKKISEYKEKLTAALKIVIKFILQLI